MQYFILLSAQPGRAEGHPAENILMEIKGFKFAQNKVIM